MSVNDLPAWVYACKGPGYVVTEDGEAGFYRRRRDAKRRFKRTKADAEVHVFRKNFAGMHELYRFADKA